MKSFIILLLIIISIQLRAQLNFFGFSDSVGDNIDIIYNEINFGNADKSDTVVLIDVTSFHLYVVEDVSKDSMDLKNFIGGEYLEKDVKLSYFNKRLKARYLLTIPKGDNLLSREIGLFYTQSDLFVVLKFENPIYNIGYNRIEFLKYRNIVYDFIDRTSLRGSRNFPIEAFYRLRILSDKAYDFVIIKERVNNVLKYKCFLNKLSIADILIGYN